MKIALLSCTSQKKHYRCKASEMYSESKRFELAYEYAKLACDKIYILSAKYGLISEDLEIEPYNETLVNKPKPDRVRWAKDVLRKMEGLFSLKEDDFLIIAGDKYCEFILPHIKNYQRPLAGKSLGHWIPSLEILINEINYNACDSLHKLFNSMSRLNWQDIEQLPYKNGIYIMFEKGEEYKVMDRIVRVGTHISDDRLINRLKDHYMRKNKDGSIFRKNIGLALLHKNNDLYEKIWDLDTSKPQIINEYPSIIDKDYQMKIEVQVTEYLKKNITFVCFEVNTKNERLRLEEGIISTLNLEDSFISSYDWLGRHNPKESIKQSGLWNTKGLNGIPLTKEELTIIKDLALGIKNQRQMVKTVINNNENSTKSRLINSDQTSRGTKTKSIKEYIIEKLESAKKNGYEYMDIISGDIHRELNLNNSMPSVCSAMRQIKKDTDIVLYTTPSGNSSTIKYRYFL